VAVSKVTPIRASYEAGQPSPYHQAPPYSLSQDAELAEASPQLRNWARHLAANSSIVKAVLDSRVSNAVGCGLTYEPLVRDRQGNLVEDLNRRIRRFLEDWRRAPEVRGELNGAELERLAWRAWDTDGEVFLRQVIRRRSGMIPYRVQLLESDLVPMTLMADRQMVQGIEQDEWGAPIAYYVQRRRPSTIYTSSQTLLDETVRVPAQDIRHLKRMVRPDQTRGLTLIHAVVFRIADIAEFAESHRLAARASTDMFASINRAPDWQPTQDAKGKDQNQRNWHFEHLQILDGLQAGESVNYLAPEHPNQNATEFLHEELRQIAAGTRSAFSQIANVFDRAYAAQRLEIVHAWRLVEQDRSQFIDDLARPLLYEAPLRWAVAAGRIQVPRRGIDPETLYDVRIEGPVMPTIDPVNDRKADELDQANGWDSRHAIIRRRGRRPSDVDAEIAQDDWTPPAATPPPARPGGAGAAQTATNDDEGDE
jgi:lambda family phage portal protein